MATPFHAQQGSTSADTQAKTKPEDTEIWQPVPKVVTPAAESANCGRLQTRSCCSTGKNVDEWVNVKDQVRPGAVWDAYMMGLMTVNKTGGNIETRRKFKNYQLHVEYKIPASITRPGRAAATAGCFLCLDGAGR